MKILENVRFHVFKYWSHGSLVSSFQTSENVWQLAQAAPPTETDVCCIQYFHMCFIHRFLLVAQPQSQCLPSPSWTDGKLCKSLLSPKSFLFVSDLCEISIFVYEIMQEWLRSTGVFGKKPRTLHSILMKCEKILPGWRPNYLQR